MWLFYFFIILEINIPNTKNINPNINSIIPNAVLNVFIINNTMLDSNTPNTKEYNLIMGLLNTYGVLSYDKFYEMFNNIISCDKEYLFERLTILNNFYGEFELYFSKKEKYVCNKAILKEKGIQLKDIKK